MLIQVELLLLIISEVDLDSHLVLILLLPVGIETNCIELVLTGLLEVKCGLLLFSLVLGALVHLILLLETHLHLLVTLFIVRKLLILLLVLILHHLWHLHVLGE
jgi:hypothetical protein